MWRLQSPRCLRTNSMDVDEDSDLNLDLYPCRMGQLECLKGVFFAIMQGVLKSEELSKNFDVTLLELL